MLRSVALAFFLLSMASCGEEVAPVEGPVDVAPTAAVPASPAATAEVPAPQGSAPSAQVEGELDSVKATISANLAGVKACYEGRLETSPELQGRLIMSFTVATTGAVQHAKTTENTTGDESLAACAEAAEGTIIFDPAPSEEVEVAGYPFIFAPGQ